MHIIVLGAAAGGGFPQWNCGCTACRRSRAGDPSARPRSQASLAISGDGISWHLVNASPDLRDQIARTPMLQPRAGLRSTPIRSVLLTGGDVDVVAGLLSMRERGGFDLLATASVHSILSANPIFDVLASDMVARQTVALDAAIMLEGGICATLFAVPGKVPLYMEMGEGMQPVLTDGTTVGLELIQGGARVYVIPGCAAATGDLCDRLAGAKAVFFDGTLWADDEMIRAGLGAKTGRRMGHMSLDGADGTIAALAEVSIAQKYLFHINNSNPILLDDSPERAAVEQAGWIVPEDGLEVLL